MIIVPVLLVVLVTGAASLVRWLAGVLHVAAPLPVPGLFSSMPVLPALVAVPLTLWLGKWCLIHPRHVPRWRVRSMRARQHLRLHPGRGFASSGELFFRWGRLAAYRESRYVRPGLSRRQRLLHASSYSIRLGWGHLWFGLRILLHDHILLLAPPRELKTAFLAATLLHWPGPAMSATTKADVFKRTSGIRARRGPIHVFNPEGIGRIPQTFRWSPIPGCEDPATAVRRADAFIGAVSLDDVEDASFWSEKASDYLRALFCAAAVARQDFRQVAAWVLGAGTEQAIKILTDAGYLQWAKTLHELFSQAERTTDTVKMVMSRAVAFMAIPDLADAVLPRPGDGFDIPKFLNAQGTLYLIADIHGSKNSPLAPLFACLTGEVHHGAILIGSRTRADRLDPPLLLALDEVTQICPVPLPVWLADSGGKGITVIACVHGEAQLRGRWGDEGAQTILDTTKCKMFLPAIGDPNTLEKAEILAGKATFFTRGDNQQAMDTGIIPAAVTRQLVKGRALVLWGSHAPVIARLPLVWRDWSYRRAKWTHTAVAALSAAPPPAPLPAMPIHEALPASPKQVELPWTDDTRPQPQDDEKEGDPHPW